MKNPGRDTKPSPPATAPNSETKPAPETKLAPKPKSDRDTPVNQPPDTSQNSEGGEQDPKAISESLRRIRTSGPLIIEAIKQNSDRVNEIIAQSVQGLNENKADVKGETRLGPPPPPPAPPVQKGKKREKLASRETKTQPSRPTNAGLANAGLANAGPANTGLANAGPANTGSANTGLTSAGPTNAKPAPARQNNRAGAQAAQSIAQPPARTISQKVAAAVAGAQSVTRKTTGFLSRSTVNRSSSYAANGGHNGPSTVLMQASGFKPQSGFASKVRIGLIALVVLLAAPTYFMFRDKLLIQAQPVDGDRNLVSPEDQSAQLVKLGESERAQGKYDTAMEHFIRALELAPNNPEIRFLLAQTYLVAGQPDDAMRSYQEILRIAPEHLDARLRLAEVYRTRGNWNAAYREYRNIIELNQSSPQAAAALEAIEKQQGAEQTAEQMAKNSLNRRRQPRPNAPSLPGAAVRAQVPLLSQRMSAAPGINPPAALSGARPEEKPDPRAVADTHKKLGVRYLNIREFRAAINEFLRALSLTPDDKDLYYFIGSSYHGLGLYAEAYDYYRRVDTGPYLGPAQSGTKQTEKAARDAYKRRDAQKFQSLKEEPRTEPENNNSNGPNKSNKSLMGKILDSLR